MYIMKWVHFILGPLAFLPTHHNKTYAKERTVQSAQNYLNRKGPLDNSIWYEIPYTTAAGE